MLPVAPMFHLFSFSFFCLHILLTYNCGVKRYLQMINLIRIESSVSTQFGRLFGDKWAINSIYLKAIRFIYSMCFDVRNCFVLFFYRFLTYSMWCDVRIWCEMSIDSNMNFERIQLLFLYFCISFSWKHSCNVIKDIADETTETIEPAKVYL